MEELRKWWNECPSPKMKFCVSVGSILLALYFIYDLGYAVGKLIAHLGI
ncbi:MAG: hypothetical protein IKM20_02850 [Erysipelotrichales bacterium]|nr:hypothetical protein [Erysipelotrichales bacterium]